MNLKAIALMTVGAIGVFTAAPIGVAAGFAYGVWVGVGIGVGVAAVTCAVGGCCIACNDYSGSTGVAANQAGLSIQSSGSLREPLINAEQHSVSVSIINAHRRRADGASQQFEDGEGDDEADGSFHATTGRSLPINVGRDTVVPSVVHSASYTPSPTGMAISVGTGSFGIPISGAGIGDTGLGSYLSPPNIGNDIRPVHSSRSQFTYNT